MIAALLTADGNKHSGRGMMYPQECNFRPVSRLPVRRWNVVFDCTRDGACSAAVAAIEVDDHPVTY
jgi:hypothetical protein